MSGEIVIALLCLQRSLILDMENNNRKIEITRRGLGDSEKLQQIICQCGLIWPQRTTRTTRNAGRHFFSCPRYKDIDGGCKFFKWETDETCNEHHDGNDNDRLTSSASSQTTWHPELSVELHTIFRMLALCRDDIRTLQRTVFILITSNFLFVVVAIARFVMWSKFRLYAKVV